MRAPARLLAAALVAVACAPTPAAGPPELRLGIDECSRCRMIVSEAATAAVARGPAGEEARFDDLACLAAFAGDVGGEGWRIWVHALDRNEWLAAEGARYRRQTDRITPMGSGLVALASPPADPEAVTFGWRELIDNREEVATDETD